MTEDKEAVTDNNITIIEKNIHRTNLQRLTDTLCLFFPIAAAFAGCFFATPVWKLFFKNETAPELIKFGAALICFAITSSIEFVFTRQINPIMKIGIFSGNKKTE